MWCGGTDEDDEPCEGKAEAYSFNGRDWAYRCEDCGWNLPHSPPGIGGDW